MARKTSDDDPLADLVDELYTAPPADFIAIRDARAAEIADKQLVKAVKALRKPTVAAWVVNLLVRSRREHIEQFIALGPELAEAQRDLDGPALQALSVKRQRVVHALVRQARELAAEAGNPVAGAAVYEVETTLHAALADPAIADRLLEARLLKSESYAGMGPAADAQEWPKLRSVTAAPGKAATKDTKADAARAAERGKAEKQLVDAQSELEDAQQQATGAAAALAEVEEQREQLASRAAELRAQLADVERRTAEADLDRRRLGKVNERASMHLTRTREQAANAATRLERLTD